MNAAAYVDMGSSRVWQPYIHMLNDEATHDSQIGIQDRNDISNYIRAGGVQLCYPFTSFTVHLLKHFAERVQILLTFEIGGPSHNPLVDHL